MKKIKFELDTTKNIFAVIILNTFRFFAVPINLSRKYFVKFKLSKTSRFYNMVNYPLAELIVKKLILAIIIEYLFITGLYLFDFDENSILIAASLLALIVFTPSVLKILFIFFVIMSELIFRLLKTLFFTFKSLFTETV